MEHILLMVGHQQLILVVIQYIVLLPVRVVVKVELLQQLQVVRVVVQEKILED